MMIGKTAAPLTPDERNWLLTAARNRRLWAEYHEQVSAVRQATDVRLADQVTRQREGA